MSDMMFASSCSCCDKPDCFGCNRGHEFSQFRVEWNGPNPTPAVALTGSGSYNVGAIKVSADGQVFAQDEFSYEYSLPDITQIFFSGVVLDLHDEVPCRWEQILVENYFATKRGKLNQYGPGVGFKQYAARQRTSQPSVFRTEFGDSTFLEDVSILATFPPGVDLPAFSELDGEYDPASFHYNYVQNSTRLILTVAGGVWTLELGVSWQVETIINHWMPWLQEDGSYSVVADGTTSGIGGGQAVHFTKVIECAVDFKGFPIPLTRPESPTHFNQASLGIDDDADMFEDLPIDLTITPIE